MLVDMPVIRSAGIRGFRDVVEELGGDSAAIARRVGLPVEALFADDVLVEDVVLARVLEIGAVELGCPDLGLRVAARQDVSLLGPLALAIQNAPSIGEALEATSRYLFVHAPGMRIWLQPDPDGVRGVEALRYDVTPPGIAPPRQGTDVSLGSLHRAIVSLVGGSYGLRTVDLPHQPLAPRHVYEDFFGAQVRFGRPAALLRLPSSLGDLPLVVRDESVRQMALDFLARQSPVGDAVLASQTRGVLQQLLGTGAPSITVVAHLLDLHPRTLQRRLADEGTTFAAVLDDVRRDVARRHLVATELPLSQVAGLLGFSEQAVLSRACRRWWGLTPGDVRRRGEPRGWAPCERGVEAVLVADGAGEARRAGESVALGRARAVPVADLPEVGKT
jgi:AraC-like DNA-binding protein